MKTEDGKNVTSTKLLKLGFKAVVLAAGDNSDAVCGSKGMEGGLQRSLMRLPFGKYSFTLRSFCYFLPLLPHFPFSVSLPHNCPSILFKARLEGGDGV